MGASPRKTVKKRASKPVRPPDLPPATLDVTVSGLVTWRADRSAAAHLRITAFVRTRAGDVRVGVARSDAIGRYLIRAVLGPAAARSDARPSLVLTATPAYDSTLLARTDPIVVRERELTVDLSVGPPGALETPDLIRLQTKIATALGSRSLTDLNSKELASLAERIGEPEKTVRALADATRGAAAAEVPIDIAYALVREGHPIDLDKLSAAGGPALRKVIADAVDGRVIPPVRADAVDLLLDRTTFRSSDLSALGGFVEGGTNALPDAVKKSLQQRSIQTLQDLRAAGGFASFDELGGDRDDPIVQRLDGHARLSALTSDVAVRNALLDAGLTGVSAIARTNASNLERTLDGRVDPRVAARLHESAKAQESVASNVITDLRGSLSDPDSLPFTNIPSWLYPKLAPKCECRDCEAAVSPLAYLADLMSYLKDNVWDTARPAVPIDWRFLEQHFKQPFGQLPTACDAVDATVRQARIAVEVMRARLAATPPSAAPQAGLTTAERDYLRSVYEALLVRLGTSLEELRLLRVADADTRRAAAARIGVPAPAGGVDRVSDLLLDTEGAPLADLEQRIEELFGYVNTRTNPLHARTTPLLVTWRRDRLREVWRDQDWPADVPASVCLVDPDVIGPDDFRTPDTSPAFQVWTKRRNWIDAQLNALRGLSVDEMIAQMSQAHAYPVAGGAATRQWPAPPNDLESLYEQAGSATADQDAMAQLQDRLATVYGLSVDGLNRVMEVRIKEAAAAADTRNPRVDATEYTDVRSILVQSLKQLLLATWRMEETNQTIDFGPKEFWIAVREPVEGDWPPEEPAGTPLVDPELLRPQDLPDSAVGDAARALFATREGELAQLRTDLQAVREDPLQGFDGMQDIALGTPLAVDLDQTLADLLSSDSTTAQQADQTIRTRLFMDPDQFRVFMGVRAKDAAGDPTRQPTAAEYKDVYQILESAQKRRQKYPTWIAAEQAANMAYWEARKASVPRWRGGIAARIEWQAALRVRQRPPLIDPDLISTAHLRAPAAANPAVQMWNTRATSIANYRTALDAAPKTTAGFDGIVQAAVGVSLDDLSEISAAADRGDAISKRLDQLNLSFASFNVLTRVAALLAANQAVLAHEWRDAFDVLTQVWKTRNSREWQAEERTAMTLSPDHFQLPPIDPTTFPPPTPPPLNAFRASSDALLDWEGMLDSRLQADAGVQDALDQVVAAAEEAMLPTLRDSLIAATTVPAAAAADRARYLSGVLMIDMKGGGCATTTRVAQAIETVQSLLFLVRSGQQFAIDTLRTLALTDTANTTFDADWEWMGSYSTWRAAMFVFLYPENILLPSLRTQPTPVFADLVKSLRSAGRLSPADALAAAREYQAYFEDVCALDLGWATKGRVGPDGTAEQRLFLFARSPKSDKVFWCTRDASSAAATQTFWREVPGLESAQSIVGAIEYEMSPATRFLYLFVTTTDVARPKLVFVQYDLVKHAWASGEPSELELPTDRPFPTLVQLLSASPPAFYFQFADGTDATRSLADNGQGWQGNDFTPVTVTETLAAWEDGSRSREGLANESLFRNPPPFWARLLLWLKTANEHAKNAGSDYVAGFPTFEQDDDRFGIVMLSSRLAEVWPFQNFANQAPPQLDTRDSLAPMVGNAHSMAVQQGFTSGFPIVQEQNGIWTWTDIAVIKSDILQVSLDYFGFSSYLDNAFFQPARAPRSSTDQQFDGSDFATRFAQANRYKPSTSHFGFPTFSETPGLPLDRVCHFPTTRVVTAQTPAPLVSEAITDAYKPGFAGPFAANPSDTLDRQALRSVTSAAYQANAQLPASFLAYFDEAWNFVPVHLALQLQQSGHYQQALDWFRLVYDYTAPLAVRRIFYGLTREHYESEAFQREADWGWLRNDPLDPHRIARTRRDTYTRFTLLAIVRCLLDFGDAEFTRDTPESIPRARLLYEAALALLDDPALSQKFEGVCDDLIGTLQIQYGDEYIQLLDDTDRNWPSRFDRDTVSRMANQIETILNGGGPPAAKSKAFKALLKKETDAHAADDPSTLDALLTLEDERRGAAVDAVLMVPEVVRRAQGTQFTEHIDNTNRHVPAAMITACIPPNPIARMLKLRAEANLYKIRTCRNIAGVKRDLEAYAAPTDTVTGLPSIGRGGQLVVPGLAPPRPTPYRYTTLIERSKQLVQLAQQTEGAMLSALQMRDNEAYNLMKARQDVQHTRAGVTLQDLRVSESQDEEDLAELQRDRADIQLKTYEEWIDRGLIDQELAMIAGYYVAAGLQAIAASNGALLTQLSTPTASVPYVGAVVTAAIWVKAAAESQIAMAQAITSHMSVLASFERKKQEWELSRDLARQDVAIGNQQIRLAQDRTRITKQERVIAQLDADNAERTVEFLSTKFTNVELYDWMSGVLESVYRFFLQQATAMAQLAASQLGFERQETPPPYIQADYWQPPSEDSLGSTTGSGPDRRGLTGSARLLQDIVQLDQYAFETNRRKLQLTKTISLAQIAPIEFQEFRRTGMLRFATPMELFDRDFPGHYLRLIRRVRTSVVALVPPVLGIKATLTSGRITRTVIGGDMFQTVRIQRGPESVALTSPRDATGMFEMDTQPDMLGFFEGIGVDGLWELQLPRASNPFDFDTIADVLISFEYTALSSADYYAQIIQTPALRGVQRADRMYSLRQDFADAWYDLHNPEQASSPLVVTLDTKRGDFPPNLSDLRIEHVAWYIASTTDKAIEVRNVQLFLTASQGTVGGAANTSDGMVSTRRGNAGAWSAMIGRSPVGRWQLQLPNTEQIRTAFADPGDDGDGQPRVADVLLVVSYSGRPPAWPS